MRKYTEQSSKAHYRKRLSQGALAKEARLHQIYEQRFALAEKLKSSRKSLHDYLEHGREDAALRDESDLILNTIPDHMYYFLNLTPQPVNA